MPNLPAMRILIIALIVTACGYSTAPTSHPNLNTARASLLSADTAFASTTTAQGLVQGFISAFADSAIYEQTGEPIIVGRANIQATLTALYTTPGYSLTWKALFADVSSAGDVGYTYGEASQVDPPGDTILGPGKQPLLYIAFWRRTAGVWKVEAFMTSPGSATPTVPTGSYATPTNATAPAYISVGKAGDRASVLAADQAFSDLSVYVGQDSSFTMYADTFGVQTGNDFVYGKTAIRSYYGATTTQQVLSWTPTLADVASSNDLAYTAGPYVFIGGGTSFYGQYLSIWKREPSGDWRYLQDGGPFTGSKPVSP
jgi:ketosteroid isomerase-like protein